MKPQPSSEQDKTTGPIIVTGARGRLASVLCSYLEMYGLDVVRVSRTAGEHILCYQDLMQSGLLSQASSVVHCAWSSLPSTAELHPHLVWSEDLPLLARLLQEISTSRTPAQLVFLSSGGAVYGECTEPAREDHPLKPLGWYGAGKVAAEFLIGQHHQRGGLPTCILRVSNPYGFAHTPEKPQGIVGAALQALRTGRPLRLMGGGKSRKDFLHIEDFERAVLAAVRHRLTGIYNVCFGESHSILEVIGMIETIAGEAVPRVDAPDATWDVHASLLDRSRLTEAAEWWPDTPLIEGLTKVVRSADT